MTHIRRMLLLTFILLLTPLSTSHAVPLFDTNFETCTTMTGNDWPCEDWTDGNSEHLPILPNISSGIAAMQSTAAAFSGIKGVVGVHDNKGTPGVNGGNTYRDSIHHALPTSVSRHIFARWAFHEAAGFEFCAINGSTKLVRFLGNGNPKVWITNNNGRYVIANEAPYDAGPGVTELYYTNVTVSTSAWQQIEFEWELNTPGQYNGLLRVWIDGVLKVERLNRAWVGPTPTSTGINHTYVTPSNLALSNMQIYMQCGLGTMYYDRIAVGTTRIGLIGAPPTDTTPPTTPVLSALSTSGTQNVLTWTASTDSGSGMASHTVLFCTGAACTPSTPISVGATATSYVHTGLASSTLYRYSVRGNDVNGNSSTASNIQEITTVAAGSAYYTPVFSDTFTRADASTLGAAWQTGYGTDTALRITTNQVRPLTINLDATQSYNTAVANDIAVSMTLSQVAGSGTRAPGILVRYGDPTSKNGYDCRTLLPTTARMAEWNAGTSTVKSTVTVTAFAANDKIWCEAIGTTISMYRERAGVKTLLTSFTDATHASGKVGIIHYQATGTLGDVQVDDFNVFSVSSTPAVPPTVTGLTLDVAGANVTFGPTTPTQVRVYFGTNSGSFSDSIIEPISAFPSGRYTRAWLSGLNYAGFAPIDSAGIENTAVGAAQARSFGNILPPIDQTPVVFGAAFPLTNRPAGTTSVAYGVVINKPAACKSHASDVAYVLMGTDLTVASLNASGVQTGLTNGSTTIKYIRCNFINDFDEEYPNLTSQAVNIVVDTATVDVTPPGAPTDPVATPVLNSSDVTVTWGAASGGDVALYHVYRALSVASVCGTFEYSGNSVTATIAQVSNGPLQELCFKIRAEDTSGNLGDFSVDTLPITTGSLPDIEPPTDPGTLRVTPYRRSALFVWPAGVDNSGKPSTSVELCQGTSCTDFASAKTTPSDDQLSIDLTPGTSYRARMRHCDATGNCTIYSNIVSFTTRSTGLTRPRVPLQFGAPRTPAVGRTQSGTRTPR